MCAAVGFPVLRLIRVQIEGLSLSALQPGRVEEWEKTDFFNKLNL